MRRVQAAVCTAVRRRVTPWVPCETPCGAVWRHARRVKRRAAPCGTVRRVQAAVCIAV